MSVTATRPTRVLLVAHPVGSGGGIAAFTEHLAQRLGADLDVVTVRYRRLYPAATAPGRAERARVPAVTRGPVPYLPWTWLGTLRDLYRLRPSIVVLQWWHPLLTAYLLTITVVARVLGVRVALVCHNATPHERFPLARLLSGLAFRSVDRIWTLSDHVADGARRLAPHTIVDVLSHPPNIVAPAARPADAARDGAPQLLFFGHVRPYKGLEDLLEALALTTHRPAPRLVAAGVFYTPIADVRRLAERLGVADRVELRDEYVPDDEVPALFAAADVVVLPYREASQSGVLSLAAEFGRPVVATDVGSLSRDVGSRGIVVPPQSPATLAQALDLAAATPPLPPAASPGGWRPWVAAVSAAATAPRRMPGTGGRSRLGRFAWLAVIAFTAAVFARAIATAHTHTWPSGRGLALAVSMLVLARVVHVAQWHLLATGYGARLRATQSARILTTAELARFVPGGIWHFAAGYRLGTKAGIASPVVVATMCCDLALRLTGAFALFLVTLAWWPHLSAVGIAAICIGGVVAVLLLRPRTARGLAGTLARYRGEAAMGTDLATGRLVATTGLSIVASVLRGAAAVAVIAGSRHVGLGAAVAITGAAALAWAIGVLVPFAPGGLGVQEASGAALMSVFVPAAAAAGAVIVLRVLRIVVEAGTAAVAYAIDVRRSPAPAAPSAEALAEPPAEPLAEAAVPATPSGVAR